MTTYSFAVFPLARAGVSACGRGGQGVRVIWEGV